MVLIECWATGPQQQQKTEFGSRPEDSKRHFNIFSNSNHPVYHFHERL